MLAAKMYGVDDIRLEEIPVPVPQTGEILLKVKAAAVCGTDVRMIKNGAAGIDEQLNKAIEVILEELKDYKPLPSTPEPRLLKDLGVK